MIKILRNNWFNRLVHNRTLKQPEIDVRLNELIDKACEKDEPLEKCIGEDMSVWYKLADGVYAGKQLGQLRKAPNCPPTLFIDPQPLTEKRFAQLVACSVEITAERQAKKFFDGGIHG